MATPADRRWPGYLERALRAPAPDVGIVEASTLVVAFGDPVRAHVATTLGINPSSAEFLDRSGQLPAGELPTRHPRPAGGCR